MEEVFATSFGQIAAQNIWAALSIALLFYINKSQEKRDRKQETREANYQEMILELTKHLQIVKSIQSDLKNIESSLADISKNTNHLHSAKDKYSKGFSKN